MRFFKRYSGTTGFSFVELLITLGVFSILIGAILGFFASQRDTYIAEDHRLERDQNLRMAVETIFRELSTAGDHAADSAFVADLAKWVPPAYIPSCPLTVTLDANPKITLGDGDLPDVITFAAAVSTEANPTSLSGASGGTVIGVSLSNTKSESQFKSGDILAVGYLPEYARVSAVSGNTLTIDADPEISGLQPLSGAYPSGTPVTEVSVVSYAVFNDANDPAYKRHEAGRPLLKRKINSTGFYPVAENISGLKVSEPEAGLLQVALTGRVTAGAATGSGGGDASASVRISLRNAVSAGFATQCIKPASPVGLTVAAGLDAANPCRILLSWDPVTTDLLGNDLAGAGCPVTGYRIFFDTVAGAFGNYVDVAKEDASGYTLDVSGVPGPGYYLCVAAENSGGIGDKSSEDFISDVTSPAAPQGLSASVAGSNEVAVSWDENSECDLAGYFLYRKKNAGAFALATGLISSGSGYPDTGLESGAGYSYRLEAVDHGFNASASSDTVTVAVP